MTTIRVHNGERLTADQLLYRLRAAEAENEQLREALTTIERMISLDPDEGWSLSDIQAVHAIAANAMSRDQPTGGAVVSGAVCSKCGLAVIAGDCPSRHIFRKEGRPVLLPLANTKSRTYNRTEDT